MSEESDVFNTRDEIYLIFTENKYFLFYTFYRLHTMSH